MLLSLFFNEIYIYFLLNFIKILGIFLLITSLLVLLSNNTVNSVFFLILSFVNTANLLILSNNFFFGFIFIIIYVGAIAVLFLFIIMFINLNNNHQYNNNFKIYNVLFIFLVAFFIIFLFNENNNNINLFFIFQNFLNYKDWSQFLQDNKLFINISQVLYNIYNLEIIFAGFLLFLPLIGVIMLTLIKSITKKKQSIFKQINSKIQYNVINYKFKY